MAVERLALAELTPDPGNARLHGERNLGAIAASLREFGQQKPIVVDRTGRVVAGNGTLAAARSLGWTHISVVRTELEGDAARAFALADNRTAELAEWDRDVLASQLATLPDELRMDIGWDAKDLAALTPARDLPEDEPPPLQPDVATRAGDIIVMGAHRLACGSCLDAALVERLMDGRHADCVLTDPPYNVAYVGKTADRLTIENDAMPAEEFARFLAGAYTRMLDAARPGATIYVFHADSTGEVFRRELVAAGWSLRQVLVWVKDAFVLGRQDWHWQHEPILYGWKPGAAHAWYGARNQATVLDDDPKGEAVPAGGHEELLRSLRECTTVVREPRPRANAEHPTMKPVRLVGRLLQNSTAPGDCVLDPFAGSGSTLIACEHLGRQCRAVELDPRYCDVIASRWEQVTGERAVRLRAGSEAAPAEAGAAGQTS